MYAVIQTGGRQLKVEPGAVVSVDRLAVPAGDDVVFDQVLFVAADGGQFTSGAPLVDGARVVGVVDGAVRGPKIRVLRKKRRKAMRRTIGHRAELTRVRITGIETGGSHGA